MSDNIEETKRKIAVMQAYVDGAKICMAFYGWHKGDKVEIVPLTEPPSWNWDCFEYLVALEEDQNHD